MNILLLRHDFFRLVEGNHIENELRLLMGRWKDAIPSS